MPFMCFNATPQNHDLTAPFISELWCQMLGIELMFLTHKNNRFALCCHKKFFCVKFKIRRWTISHFPLNSQDLCKIQLKILFCRLWLVNIFIAHSITPNMCETALKMRASASGVKEIFTQIFLNLHTLIKSRKRCSNNNTFLHYSLPVSVRFAVIDTAFLMFI